MLQAAPEARVARPLDAGRSRYVREAFAAGASGYVLKEAADAEVVTAIREVARGGSYVHPALGARLVAAEADGRRRAEEDPLSEREREVLRLLALGHTNQEIAEAALHLGPDGRDPPRAHHAEARPGEPCGARPLRVGGGPAHGRPDVARGHSVAARLRPASRRQRTVERTLVTPGTRDASR